MDQQKLEEIEKAATKIWKLADNLPVNRRQIAIKHDAELIKELVASIKDKDE